MKQNYQPTAQERRDFLAFAISGERRDLTAGPPLATGAPFVAGAFDHALTEGLKQYDQLFDAENCTVLTTTTGAAATIPIADDTNNAAVLLPETQQDVYADPKLFMVSLPIALTWTSGAVRCTIPFLQDIGVSLPEMFGDLFGPRFGRGLGPSLVAALVAGAQLGTTAAGSAKNDGTAATGANSIGTQDLVNLRLSVDPAYRRSKKCAWVMSDSTLAALDNVLDKQGRPCIEQTYDADGNRLLYGFRVCVSPSMASIATGAKTVVFGDLRYLVFRQVENSLGLIRNNERYMDTLEIGFSAILRANMGLAAVASQTAPVKYLIQA